MPKRWNTMEHHEGGEDRGPGWGLDFAAERAGVLRSRHERAHPHVSGSWVGMCRSAHRLPWPRCRVGVRRGLGGADHLLYAEPTSRTPALITGPDQ